MRKLLSLFFALATFSLVTYAQTKTGKISGSVIDGSQKTIEASTITLLRAKDSSVARISAADKNGKFEFDKVADGKYFVSISAVGHQKGNSEVFEITPEKNAITLKTIELIPQTKALGAVTVTAKRPLV